jgi:hypothetical protein
MSGGLLRHHALSSIGHARRAQWWRWAQHRYRGKWGTFIDATIVSDLNYQTNVGLEEHPVKVRLA